MLIVHVLAQAAVAAAPTAQATPQQGVISYPPSFFEAFQPANASEMVLRLPGFILESGADVRGYEGAAGNVLIDGERPATKSEDLEQVLRRIPASRIERIDLIRGGAPGIDMQGKSVIANIIRKPGGGFRGVAAASVNNSWDGRHMPSVRLEGSGDAGPRRWELGLFAGTFIDDGNADGTGVRVTPNPTGAQTVTPLDIDSEGDGANAQLTGVYETPIFGGKVRMNGRVFSEKYKSEDNSRLFPPTPGLELSTDTIRTDRAEIGGTWTRKVGERTSIEVVGLRQDEDQAIDSFFRNGTDYDFALRRESSETIARSVLKYSVNPRLSFEGGGEFAVNKLDSRTRYIQDGAAIDLPAANVEVQEDRGEVFAKSVWRPTDQWTFDASLRYETSKISSEGDVVLSKRLDYLKPRVAVTWAPTSATQLRFRVEREVGQLDFDDFVADADFSDQSGVSAGNPDLDPEQAWVGEATIEQRFWGAGSLTLSYRHYEISDVIDRGPVEGDNGEFFDQPTNIGDGTKDELALQLSLPLDKVGLKSATLKGDVTKRWTEVVDPTTGETREISDLRPIDWNATFTHDLPNWKLSYGVDAYGGWRETEYRFNSIRTTKARTYVKPFVEYRPRSDINIRLELPNVTARDFKRTVQTWPGLRNAGGAPSLDDREYHPGQMIYFRIRKTLGG